MLWQKMRVLIQRHCHICVAKSFCNHKDVHSTFDASCCKCMSECMEVSVLNSCVLQDFLIVLVENTRFDREILDAYKYKVLLGVRKSVLLYR